jgi:stringent starvation protein B
VNETSTKPYLLRALYEWCVDNGFTPYLSVVVNATTRVPPEYVRNGEIVLNIGPLAANRLKMTNESIDFSARFGGTARELSIPVAQVAALYARENGHGMSFEIDRTKPPLEASGQADAQPSAQSSAPPEAPDPAPSGGKPTLRVIK